MGQALPLAIGLTAWQAVHASRMRRTLWTLDVQVRIAYAGLLLLGHVEPLWPIHLVQFVGVNALLVVDRCLLARLLVLMPWNRVEPLTVHLVRKALFTTPAAVAIHSMINPQAAHGLG